MKARADRGFTLVELLVSTALLALLMLALLAALRSFGQTEDRLDRLLQRDAELRTGASFLRGIVSAIAPRPLKTGAGMPKRIEFRGTAGELRWVGVMPARQGAGGLYRFRLARRTDGESPALVLQFAPYVAGAAAPVEGGAHESRVMAGRVRSVSFRYLGDDAGAGWLDAWPDEERLPRRIGMKVATDRDEWPEILVTVVPVAGPDAPSRPGTEADPPPADLSESPT